MALPGNPYSYAASNPLGYVDPTGLIEERLGLDQYPTPGELLFWNVVETVGAASAAMLVILAAPVAGTAVGIAALTVGGALTASHLTAVVEDWEAYLQGDYGSVGGNDPVYAWAAEHLGSWGTVALGIAEGVFWARFPGMTGLTAAGAPLAEAGRGHVDVWHSTTSSSAAGSVLNAIDPKFFNPHGRFGPAFYVSGEQMTAALEVSKRGTPAFVIRYRLDLSGARVLELTDPAVAARWGFTPGASLKTCQAVGVAARASGYTVVVYPSYAAAGTNYAILEGFSRMLKPVMIVPTQ
jgi:RES domain-containing protein